MHTGAAKQLMDEMATVRVPNLERPVQRVAARLAEGEHPGPIRRQDLQRERPHDCAAGSMPNEGEDRNANAEQGCEEEDPVDNTPGMTHAQSVSRANQKLRGQLHASETSGNGRLRTGWSAGSQWTTPPMFYPSQPWETRP